MNFLNMAPPQNHSEAMDYLWQLLKLFESYNGMLHSTILELNEATGLLSIQEARIPPDWITACFYRNDRKYAALADLMLRLLTGGSVLESLEDFDEDSLEAILAAEDRVFQPEDLEAIPQTLAIPEAIRSAIPDLSARESASVQAALARIRDACRQEPCRYTLALSSMNGTAQGQAEVSVTPEQEPVLWPQGDPVVSLSDGRIYSFRYQHLRYRPGTHRMELTAVADVTPQEQTPPAPAPVSPPLPDSNPTPIADPVFEDEARHVIVGIDLGTEKTCVADTQGNLIYLEDDSPSIPSFLFYLNAQDSEIGKAAKNRGHLFPQACVTAFKRHIGDSKVISGVIARDGTHIRQTGMDTSARFLSAIRQRMEESDLIIDKLVITVPADFNNVKRAETFRAASMAGFQKEDVRLLEEPTAAAFYYGCHNKPGLTATYDLGGGTFDFCLLNGSPSGSDVVGKGGNTRLGGTDFTREIIHLFLQKAEMDGIDLPREADAAADRDTAAFYYQLRDAAERAKIALSLDEEATVSVTWQKAARLLSYRITRQEFEQRLLPYLAQTRAVVGEVFQRSGYTPDQVDRVVIIGGSTLIPAVDRQIRQELFPNCACFLDDNRISPVALGAAEFARSVWPEDTGFQGLLPVEDPIPDPPILPTNRTTHDLGVLNSMNEFTCIIPAGTEYTRQGCSGEAILAFARDSGSALTVNLHSRAPGAQVTRRSLFAANSPFKHIGKLHFCQIPSSGMLQRSLSVRLTLNCDGVLSAEAQILRNGQAEYQQTASIESI